MHLLDLVLEVRAEAAVLSELRLAYPVAAATASAPRAVLRCAREDRGWRIDLEPGAGLADLFAPELADRFELGPDGVLDQTSQIRFRRKESSLLAEGPVLRVLDVVLLHLALLTARRAQRDPLLLHGAGLVSIRSGKALLLLGPSGTGKTTLAEALCRRGMACLSDEIIAIEGRDAVAYPRAVAMRDPGPGPGPAAKYVSARGETKYLVDPRTLGAPAPPPRAGIGALVLLEPYGSRFEVSTVRARTAATELLAHAYTGRDDPARLLLRLAALCGSVSCSRVRPGHPDETAAQLEALLV